MEFKGHLLTHHFIKLDLVLWLDTAYWLIDKRGSRCGRLGRCPVTGTFQAQLHCVSAELSKYHSWGPYPTTPRLGPAIQQNYLYNVLLIYSCLGWVTHRCTYIQALVLYYVTPELFILGYVLFRKFANLHISHTCKRILKLLFPISNVCRTLSHVSNVRIRNCSYNCKP